MGLKTPKLHSGLLRNIKSFNTKFHSAQQNELYVFIQVICLHPYPINIVSDSIYSVFVLKNIKTSTINSNQPIIQRLFFELQSVVRNHNSPIYITHIRTHSCLLGSMTYEMNKLINWFSLLLQRNNMLCCITMMAPYISYGKIPYHQAKEIINNCSTCRPLHL